MDYSLCGLPLRLECCATSVERRVMRVLHSLFSLAPFDPSVSGPGIEIRIGDAAEGSISGEVVFDAPELCSIRTERGYHLRSYESFLSLDLNQGVAVGTLSDAFLNAPLEEQRGLLLFVFLLLLSARGLYALHAGGVMSPNGQGVLLAGVSGSGKTTLTWALTRSGWSYLSDDSVLLKDTLNGVESLALGRPFHCAPSMFKNFPELVAKTSSPATGKRLVEVDSIYPDRIRKVMRPHVILFPEIATESQTRAIPLSGTETLVHLLKSGAAKLHDRTSMTAQMVVLARLAGSTRGFRLLHGTDVHRNPERVAALVQQLACSEGECNDLYSAA